jgi:hypothetical protein
MLIFANTADYYYCNPHYDEGGGRPEVDPFDHHRSMSKHESLSLREHTPTYKNVTVHATQCTFLYVG